MFYHYDRFGWYDGKFDAAGDRTTEVEPANKSLAEADGESRANWTGHAWADLAYRTPSPEELNPQAYTGLPGSVFVDGVEVLIP